MNDTNNKNFAASLSEADDLTSLYEDSIEENIKYQNYNVSHQISKDAAKKNNERHKYLPANIIASVVSVLLTGSILPGVAVGTGITAIRNSDAYSSREKAINDFIDSNPDAADIKHDIQAECDKKKPDPNKIAELKEKLYQVIKNEDPEILKEAEDTGAKVNTKVKSGLSYDETHRHSDIVGDENETAGHESINEAVIWLYKNGHEITEDNVIWAKRLLESVKQQEKAAKPEKTPAEGEEPAQEDPNAEEQAAPTGSKEIAISPEGEIAITTPGAAITATKDGVVNLSMAESFIASRDMNRLVKSILVEDCHLDESDIEGMDTASKNDMIATLMTTYLGGITDRLENIDTSAADRSKGDIKNLKELPDIQKAITQLEEIINRAENSTSDEAVAIRTVISAIRNINQYSMVFKEAYRNKKTVMIMKYQSLILSIISSIMYILSTIVDTSDGDIKLKDTVDENLMDFRPLKALKDFNDSVDNGSFKKMVNDTSILREYYLEVPVATMSKILEDNEYATMVTNGLKNLYNGIINNPKVTQIIYKLASFLVLLLSVRDSIYPLYKMKSSVSSMLGTISNFANINSGNGNVLAKVSQYSDQFKNDADLGNEIASREIDNENRKLAIDARAIKQNTYQPATAAPVSKPTTTATDDIFGNF